MEYQSPDSNNPCNPLLKAAALTLDKEQKGRDPAATSIKVIARLTFKRSNDFRGFAKGTSGEDVTVCFSVCIKRASFQISFGVDDPQVSAAKFVELEKIAFHSTLVSKVKITDTRYLSNRTQRKFSAGLSIAARAMETGGFLDGCINGAVEHSGSSVARSARRSKKKSVKTNVSVTITPDKIHWEIEPDNPRLTGERKSSYLLGDVFLENEAEEGKILPACELLWNGKGAGGSLLVSGSVFTLMDDLEIGEVRFLDDLGKTVPWRSVDDPQSGNSTRFHKSLQSLANSGAKERFVKQIIRKHLVSQGMKVEGARVEICSAYT
jgi:hypothetical protein